MAGGLNSYRNVHCSAVKHAIGDMFKFTSQAFLQQVQQKESHHIISRE